MPRPFTYLVILVTPQSNNCSLSLGPVANQVFGDVFDDVGAVSP